MRAHVSILFVVLVAVPVASAQQEGEALRTLTMRGWGVATQVPDRAVLSFSVESTGETIREAFEANAEATALVLDAMRSLDVPEGDIHTEGLTVRQSRDEHDREAPFRAFRSTSLIIDDVGRVPELVARVVEAGATYIGYLRYLVQDRKPLEAQALEEAMSHAREKAEAVAAVEGLRVGRILGVAEQGTQPLISTGFALSAGGAREARPPDFDPGAYAPGEYEIHASVIVTYELEKP